MRSLAALQAYKKSASHRTVKEQEADVFLRVNAILRGAAEAEGLTRAKALADNERLWITLMDVLRDPSNQLPAPLRASVLSVGHAVRREAALAQPDFKFLIGINEQVAAGLAGN
jgi:flagellar biosynthesis regulator FlaF